MVPGRSVLYPYPNLRTTNYGADKMNYVILFPGLLSRWVVEKGSRELLLLLLYARFYIIIKCNIINCCLLLSTAITSNSNAARPIEDASLR